MGWKENDIEDAQQLLDILCFLPWKSLVSI